MNHNYTFNTFNQAIPALFNVLLRDGREVPSRNGSTLELAFTGISLYDSTAREILIPGRKHNLAAQIAETMWVLSGRNDIEWLSTYLPRAKDYSDDGVTWRGAYGKRIRDWHGYDQLEDIVRLLRATPDTRQAVVSIYDPAIDTEPGKDIPCNDFLHFLGREGVLDLHIFVRSNDMMWGWSGINVFEWSALLEVVAGLVGQEVGSLHFSVSSFHLYETHWDKAQKIAESNWDKALEGEHESSPRFDPSVVDSTEAFHNLCHQWFILEESIRKQTLPTGTVEELIDAFPEPMMRSWLRVLAWWWTSDPIYLSPLAGTNLYTSAHLAMQPLSRQTAPTLAVAEKPDLIDEIVMLHNEKDAAYGDSWCKRGEMLGIMANIARKVDRLGGSETKDETSLDTAMDLFVYLGKYRAWIDGGDRDMANGLMRTVAEAASGVDLAQDYLEVILREMFESLEDAVVRKHHIQREVLIAGMLENAWDLVVLLAESE